jgi:pimeloyl-ACP methyl ester carboxylesterase
MLISSTLARRLAPARRAGQSWRGGSFRLPAVAAPPAVVGPTYESGPCPFPAGAIPAGERVDCGNLVVAEERDQPGSPAIRLAVAILRTHNPAPAPDPIVFLADGPGGSGLDWLDYFLTRAGDLRAGRDIILLDQRGTGYSQPNLRCFEFDSLDAAARARQLSLAEARALDVQIAAACHDRLAAAGVHFAAYTTAASAADVKDLRLALGYLNWNLYGVGYGARLALSVLRDYPGGVRSVVLDAALPPQAAWWEASAANMDRAFSAFFASCARQPACSAAYPNLSVTFAEAADRLNATPVTVQVQVGAAGRLAPELVTGQRLVAGAAQSLTDARLGLIPYLPLVITQLDAGNTSVTEDFAQALVAGANGTRSGAWYSVQCHDEAPLADPAKIQADAESFARYRDVVLRDTTLAICPEWGAGQAGAEENQPAHSDVPALLLAGEFDPLEPPAWSQLAASTLSHSHYYLLGSVGHGASLLGCGQVLTVQFVENPALAPKLVCDLGASAPAYVTAAYINPGVDRLAQGLVLHFDLVPGLPFLACAVLFATALFVWPPAALLQPRGRRAAGFARWLATVTLLLDLLFAAALVALIVLTSEQQPGLLVFGLPPKAAPLFVVPWIAVALTAGLVGFTFLAWKDGYWSLAGRVHFSLVAAAAAGFLWLLYYWGLLGLQ